MLEDTVQEVRTLVERIVSSKLKQIEEQIEDMKRGVSSPEV